MFVDDIAIASLEELMDVDLELIRLQKRYDALPQRAVIEEMKEKRKTVDEKAKSVEEMRQAEEAKMAQHEDEDEKLAKKQAEVQSEIESVKGDYRSVESRTKELDGIARRREKLAWMMDDIANRLLKIGEVEAQIDKALLAFSIKEKKARDSFSEEGGQLRSRIVELEARRGELTASLSAEAFEVYEKTGRKCGGIALAKLVDEKCSVCRSSFDSTRMQVLRKNAPLAKCPSCSRLIIVSE